MRKLLKGVGAALLAVMLVALPVLAVNVATVIVSNSTGTDYPMLGVRMPLNTTDLITNNVISATGLDTRIAGGDYPHMLADDKVLWGMPVAPNSSNPTTFSTGQTALTDFDIVPGYGGYITIIDDLALEPGDDFEFEFQDAYLDTDAGAGKNLVLKAAAFEIRISAAGSITAGMGGGTFTFSPDAHPEGASVDGEVVRIVGGEAWGVIQGFATGTMATDDGVSMTAGFQTAAGANTWANLLRAYLLFDTSIIPGGSVVQSATLRVFGTTKLDNKPYGDLTFNVFSSTPALDTALAVGDYNQVGAVPFATAITFAGFDDTGWNTFTLNAAGLVAIDIAGRSKFSIREATYDAPDVLPAWAASKTALFRFETSEGVNAPELIVVLAPSASVTAINQTSGEHDVKVTADTVNLEISIDGAVAGDGYDSVALAGESVPDNANDWILMDNSTTDFMPYAASYEATVGGVLVVDYEPVSYIVGTVLPDKEGAAQNGAFTFGANPVGIATVLDSLLPESAFAAAEVALVTPDAVGVGETPDDLFGSEVTIEGAWTIFSFLPAIATILGTPLMWFYIFVSSLLWIIFYALVLKWTQNLMMAGLAGLVGIGAALAMGVYPGWSLIVGVLLVIGGATSERTASL